MIATSKAARLPMAMGALTDSAIIPAKKVPKPLNPQFIIMMLMTRPRN